jgi:hypothetical protein
MYISERAVPYICVTCERHAVITERRVWYSDGTSFCLGLVIFLRLFETELPRTGSGPGEKVFFRTHFPTTLSSQARAYQHREEQGNKARWPLAASAVVTTNHYQITSDTTGKQKHLQHGRPR